MWLRENINKRMREREIIRNKNNQTERKLATTKRDLTHFLALASTQAPFLQKEKRKKQLIKSTQK